MPSNIEHTLDTMHADMGLLDLHGISDADRFVITVETAYLLKQQISEIRRLPPNEWLTCALIAKSIRKEMEK